MSEVCVILVTAWETPQPTGINSHLGDAKKWLTGDAKEMKVIIVAIN